MPTWYENKLAGVLESIQHELVLGAAGEGDLRKIRQVAAIAGNALAGYRRNVADGITMLADRPKALSERDLAVEGLRSALQRVVADGYIEDQALREAAVAYLSTPDDGQEMAEFVREHIGNISTNASLHAANEHVQRHIDEDYLEAKYRLAMLDHLDGKWCARAWSTGCVSDKDVQAIKAEGGYQAILASPAKQEAWQDVLDHVFNERLYAVVEQVAPRKPYDELRDLSRKGVNLSYPDHNGHFRVVPKTVGAGVNVVGLTYQLAAGPRVRTATGWQAPVMIEVDDRMAMDGRDMGEFLRTRLKEAWKLHLHRSQALDAACAQEIQAVRPALAPTNDRYAAGYADALESVLLCLADRGMSAGDIKDVRDTATDAFANNAPDPEDPDADDVPAPTP